MSTSTNRRRIAPLLAALALLPPTLAATSATAAAQSASPGKSEGRGSTSAPRPYRTTILPNGLEVVVVEDHGTPLVTVDVTVRNGAFTEPDEFAGLSHLYEHMFFKANRSLPSQTEFMKRVRELGISFNGYTAEEVVTYFFTLPSKNFEAGMRFMADAIMTPLFDSTELVREREVVLGEFDRNEAQPEFVLEYALDSALWNPYVSRKQPLGQRQVIKTATIEKMRMIQKRYYVPNNSALIVSGDVDTEKVFEMARKLYGGWERGADPFPANAPPQFPTLTPRLIKREARLPYTSVSLALHGPSAGRDEPAPFQGELMSTMINQAGSRLSRRLLDSGLASRFWSQFDVARNTGVIRFTMQTEAKDARRALDVLKEELRAMVRPGYFTDEEIEIGKKIIADRPLFDRDNVFRYTIGSLAPWWSMSSLDYYSTFPENVAKVGREGLSSFARRYIESQPFIVAVGADRATLDGINITEEVLTW